MSSAGAHVPLLDFPPYLSCSIVIHIKLNCKHRQETGDNLALFPLDAFVPARGHERRTRDEDR